MRSLQSNALCPVEEKKPASFLIFAHTRCVESWSHVRGPRSSPSHTATLVDTMDSKFAISMLSLRAPGQGMPCVTGEASTRKMCDIEA